MEEIAQVTAGLVRLSFLVQEIYARVSERHDLTPVQAKLLCVVSDGPRGMAELASHFEGALAQLGLGRLRVFGQKPQRTANLFGEQTQGAF